MEEILATSKEALRRGDEAIAGLDALSKGALPGHSARIESQIGGLEAESAGKSFGRMIEDVYRGVVKGTQTLKRIDKDLSAGVPLPAERSVYAAGRATQGSARRAQGFMEHGPRKYTPEGNFEPTGTPGLKAIEDMAGGDTRALSRYQVAARTSDLAERGIETGVSPADAVAEVAGNPAMRQAHEAAVAFDRDMLQYWADAGGLSPEGLAAMDAFGQNYVHLGRVFEGAHAPGAAIGRVAQQIHKIRGNTRQIKDPWLSRIDRTARMIRAADRQRVGLRLIEAAESAPTEAANIIKRVQPKSGARVVTSEAQRIREAAVKNGIELSDEASLELAEALSDRALSRDNTISVWRNGKRETWELDPSIAQGMMALGPRDVSWFSRIAGIGTSTFKGGVTLDPAFGVINAFRDSFDAAVQSKHGFKLGLDSFRGFYESVKANWRGKPSKLYEDFVASGGGFSTLRGAGTRNVEQFAREIGGKGFKPTDVVLHPIEALKKFALPFEEGARISEFRRAKAAGESDLSAFMAQQDVTVNFQEMGTVMAGLNMQVPFLNPAIQSLDRAIKAMGKPVVKGAKGEGWGEAARVYGAAISTITLPSVYFWAASIDDQEIQDLRKTTSGLIYWFARLPNGEILRMPKPFLYGQIFGTGAESVLDQMFTDDPEAMKRWAEGVQEQAVSTALPMWAQIPSDLRANEEAFFQSPIVPRGKEGLSPHLQSGPRTTEIAKALGDRFNVSPARLEFVYRSITGSLGRRLLLGADDIVQDVLGDESSAKPKELADNPLIGRFFARQATTAKEPIHTFYNSLSEGERLKRSFDADMAAGSDGSRYDDSDRELMALLPLLRSANREIGKIRKQLDAILDSSVSTEVKQRQKKDLQDQMVEIARSVNQALQRREQ